MTIPRWSVLSIKFTELRDSFAPTVQPQVATRTGRLPTEGVGGGWHSGGRRPLAARPRVCTAALGVRGVAEATLRVLVSRHRHALDDESRRRTAITSYSPESRSRSNEHDRLGRFHLRSGRRLWGSMFAFFVEKVRHQRP